MFRQVENKGRYKTAQPFYWHIKDQDDVDYLFTDSALKEAEKRAEKNPEDIPFPIDEPASFTAGFAIGLIVGFAVTAGSYFLIKYFNLEINLRNRIYPIFKFN